MSLQKFTGIVLGAPKQLQTATTGRTVVHVTVSFITPSKIFGGKLPELGEDAIPSLQLSIWDGKFQEAIMADADRLAGTMITGYCDHVEQRDRYFNAVGYAFVEDPKGKPNAPQLQVISTPVASVAPAAPVAPVAPSV